MRIALVVCVVALFGCDKSKPKSEPKAPRPAQTAHEVDTSGYDLACRTVDDCAIVKNDPCDHCSCASTPIAKKDREKFDAQHAKIDCADVEDDRVCSECQGSDPACHNGKCIAIPEGSTPPPSGVDTRSYDHACATADDCVMVQEDPCDPCPCGGAAIAKKERDRFDTEYAAIRCGPPPEIDCGSCGTRLEATCEKGQCVARPAP